MFWDLVQHYGQKCFQKLLSAPLLVILVIYQHTAVCILGVCFKDRQVMDNAGHALGYECVQSVK